jgi:hypothetical protein
MNKIPKEQNDNGLVRALSCKSCSSCPKHLLWLRLAALGPCALALRIPARAMAFAPDPQWCVFPRSELLGIMQSQQDFYRIERKERRDNNLWYFLFAIFAIYVVKLLWLRLCRAGLFGAISRKTAHHRRGL